MSFSAGSPLLVYCTEACVGFLLFYVWCWVSLAGVLHIVLVLVVSCLLFGAGSPLLVYCTLFLCLSLFVLSCVCTWVLGWEFLFMVGRVRFPGEVGELAPYGGAPYLGWTHSAGLALYPRFG